MEHVIEYNAAPAADRFREVDAAELGEIIREIRVMEESARYSEWAYDAWQTDIAAAMRAVELMDAFSERIYVARDEDGFYFAHEATRGDSPNSARRSGPGGGDSMNLRVVTIYDAGITPAVKLGLKAVDYHCQIFDAAPIAAELIPAETPGKLYWRRDGRNLALLDRDLEHTRICNLEPRSGRMVNHQVVVCIPDTNVVTEIKWRGHIQCVGRGFLVGATDPDKHNRYWFYSSSHAFAEAHPQTKRVHIVGGKRSGCDYWEIAGYERSPLCGCEDCQGWWSI